MNKIIALILCSVLLICNTTISQNLQLTVIIVDKENSNRIENATLTVKETSKVSATNAFGSCIIKKLNQGNCTIEVSHIGYSTKIVTILLNEKNNNPLRIELEKIGLTFNNITVSSEKFNHYAKIAAIDLKLRPVNSSQDVLKIIPGLFIAQHAGGGKAEQIFLRGFDIDHGTDISVTVDGLPVNMTSHAHGQGYADLHFLNPETIEKVNFDKGPYNAEKGNLSTAGFVDFKTKDFLDKNSFKIEVGKFNMQRLSGLVKVFGSSNEKKKEQLYIASEFVKNDGYFESPQNFKRFNIMGKYSLIKNSNTKLNILFSTFNSKWNASGQIPDRAVNDKSIGRFGSIDNNEGGNTIRTNFSVLFSKAMKSNWDLSQQAYYTNYNFNLFSNFTFFLNNPINGDMINQREQRNIYGYSAKIKKEGIILNKKTTTSFGAGFRYDNIGNISLASAPKRIFDAFIQNGSIKETNSFVYANETIELTNNLTANGSLRLDNFRFGYKNSLIGDENFRYILKSAFSPKLNFNYNVSSKVSLFLNNGVGFHSNDARVILADSVKNILPKVYGTDIGISLKPTKNLIIKTIFWHLLSEQEFVYVGDEGVVEASGKSRRIGIDFITRYQATKWLYADVDVSIAKPRSIEQTKGENYIPLAPTFTSIGGLTAKLDNKLSASLRYRYMGDRAANEDYSLTAKGYFLLDAVTNYKVRNIDFSITIENMLNKKWKEAQFETTTRLQNEPDAVTEIHFTPGSPFFVKAGIAISF